MLNENDINKIQKIIRDRKSSHNVLTKNSSVYNEFLKMEEAAFKSGNLDKKYKELIATGISIAINCESCMEWHINEALKSGATYEEVMETVGVGIEMGGGPATVSSRFALKVLEYYTQH